MENLWQEKHIEFLFTLSGKSARALSRKSHLDTSHTSAERVGCACSYSAGLQTRALSNDDDATWPDIAASVVRGVLKSWRFYWSW